MSERVIELLEVWESLRGLGQDLEAGDIAPNEPAEAVDELRECIRLIRHSERHRKRRP